MTDLKKIKTPLNYVCPRCFNKIENCNCDYPPRNLILLDYNIQTIIKILNLKGYVTRNSCESHCVTDSIYVHFLKNYCFSILPKNFKYKKGVLSFLYPKETTEENFIIEKQKQLEILKNWALSL